MCFLQSWFLFIHLWGLEVPGGVRGTFPLGETKSWAASQDRGLQHCPCQPSGRLCAPLGPAASPAVLKKPPSLSHARIAPSLPLQVIFLAAQGIKQNQISKQDSCLALAAVKSPFSLQISSLWSTGSVSTTYQLPRIYTGPIQMWGGSSLPW